MDDRSDSGGHRDGARDGRHDDHSHEHRQHDDGSRPRRDGSGPDTRFLQLEMSKVMYGEAEAVTRPAFRALLLEAAKDRLRERFGDKITALAQIAVDELLDGVHASFEIEARIQQQGEERSPSRDRVRELLLGAGEPPPAQEDRRPRGRAARARRRR